MDKEKEEEERGKGQVGGKERGVLGREYRLP